MSQGRERVTGVAKLLVPGDHFQSSGMGIVVDERHVVTCAHVVNSALGRTFEFQDEPDQRIRLSFPYAGTEAVHTGRVVSWHPMGQGRGRDVAVLKLDNKVPSGTEVASLVSADYYYNNRFIVFGFRDGSIKGNIVAGRFMGLLPDETVQIDGIDDHGIFIENGFSGAAVWDTTLRAVVGMVSSRNINPDERVAYMIPVRVLKQAWPPLRIAERRIPGPPAGRSDRNRMNMIDKVGKIWINGFLQHSLFHEVRILLGLCERPDAVARPLDLLVKRPDEGERPLPSGTQVVDVYDSMDKALLILGAPGSGKTTLLLELARDLLTHATHDPAHPIPVVFPLSTWAESRKPLGEWLIDELSLRYDIPRKIAQEWVVSDEVLPLLDGLDEVKAEHRGACVEAINDFRQSHGLLPLVITSRTADYEALAEPLRLQGAILVQPLTREQVNAYLTELGPDGEPVRAAIHEDASLWDLLDSPLLLNVVTVAYAGQSETLLPMSGTAAERRGHLFGSYVRQMLGRRAAKGHYEPEQTVHWMSWLARQMSTHGLTVFYLEGLQEDWLPPHDRWAIRLGYRLGYRLVFGLIIGLGGGLFAGLVAGLTYGLAALLAEEGTGTLMSKGGQVFGLGFGLIGGLVAGLFGGLESSPTPNIHCVETARWSWSELWRAKYSILSGGLRVGQVFGLGFGLIGGLFIVLFGKELIYAPVAGLVAGLFGGLGGVLVGGLNAGLSAGLVVGEIETRSIPNQGIYRSAKNALRVGLSAGLVVGLVVGLVFGLFLELDGGLFLGLIGGLIGVLVGGLQTGGMAYLKHFALRLRLIRNGSTPWNYVRFLDHAVERILLRKVGGGYAFLHRMLLEHFADRSIVGSPNARATTAKPSIMVTWPARPNHPKGSIPKKWR